tara:strand:+ start:790 stop:1020 length:231 start_codon:yes stop_codon:yes gene_type:complete
MLPQNENDPMDFVAEVLSDMSDQWWIVLRKDDNICVIGLPPAQLINLLKGKFAKHKRYPDSKDYLNDRFDPMFWNN